MCVHLGMTSAFVWDHTWGDAQHDSKESKERWTGQEETVALLEEIETLFTETAPALGLVYRHHWEQGDFMITDNAAVAHEATEETQASVGEVGLRVLHRTTVQGGPRPGVV